MKTKLLFIVSYILLWTIWWIFFEKLLDFWDDEIVVWNLILLSVYSIILYIFRYRIWRKILEFNLKNQEDKEKIDDLRKKLWKTKNIGFKVNYKKRILPFLFLWVIVFWIFFSVFYYDYSISKQNCNEKHNEYIEESKKIEDLSKDIVFDAKDNKISIKNNLYKNIQKLSFAFSVNKYYWTSNVVKETDFYEVTTEKEIKWWEIVDDFDNVKRKDNKECIWVCKSINYGNDTLLITDWNIVAEYKTIFEKTVNNNNYYQILKRNDEYDINLLKILSIILSDWTSYSLDWKEDCEFKYNWFFE